MNRREELLDLIDNNILYVPLVNEMVDLEAQLEYLRKLPKIKIHPSDPTKQKATPAAKLYKELLQQYTNIIRILMRATGAEIEEEDSPLRRWLDSHVN